jgi:hypothetical protein
LEFGENRGKPAGKYFEGLLLKANYEDDSAI